MEEHPHVRMLLFLCSFSDFLEGINEFADALVSCNGGSPLVTIVDVIDVGIDAFFEAFDNALISGFNDAFGPFESFGVRVFEVLFVTFFTLDGGCTINGEEFVADSDRHSQHSAGYDSVPDHSREAREHHPCQGT